MFVDQPTDRMCKNKNGNVWMQETVLTWLEKKHFSQKQNDFPTSLQIKIFYSLITSSCSFPSILMFMFECP